MAFKNFNVKKNLIKISSNIQIIKKLIKIKIYFENNTFRIMKKIRLRLIIIE